MAAGRQGQTVVGQPQHLLGAGRQPADLTVFDLDAEYTVDPAEFATMGRATPFAGCRLFGRCRMTMVGGEIVWQEEKV